ncbi:MAG: class I adenylate-forming enzyme family protein [Blastocatellia bacterium]
MIRPFEYSGITRDSRGIPHYDNLPVSIVEMLETRVQATPGREALVEMGGRRMTYREVWHTATRIAGGLRHAGLGEGDRAAIQLGNGVDWCLAFLGIQLAGGVAVPVNTRFTTDEAAYVLQDSGANYCFTPDTAMPDGPPYVSRHAAADDLAAIFYTSGTTGFPRGAMMTHENFLCIVESRFRIVPLPRDAGIRTLISIPLFHVTACNAQFLPTLSAGGTVIIMPAFDPQSFLRAITGERVNQLTSVPAIYWLTLNQPNFSGFDLRGIRWLSYGGAPMPPELIGRMLEAFPNARIGNGFGLTETSSVSTFLPHEYARVRPDSVGFPIPISDARLFEPDAGTGVGELLIRGANVVKGYWNKPAATAESFVDGWLHTGDMARIDAEGFVQIVDRKKDMINRGGENVYCVEVENALAAHPGIFEVAVLGVSDTMMGEKVGAVIVARPGQTLVAEEVVAFARDHLADFKVPQYIAFRADPLPRNAGGKILKPALRQSVVWGNQVGKKG